MNDKQEPDLGSLVSTVTQQAEQLLAKHAPAASKGLLWQLVLAGDHHDLVNKLNHLSVVSVVPMIESGVYLVGSPR